MLNYLTTVRDAVANSDIARMVYRYAYIDGAITATVLALVVGYFVCG